MMATVPALHVIGAGPFGGAVAEAILAARPEASATLAQRDLGPDRADGPGAVLPPAAGYVLAAGCPMPGYAAALDQVAFEQGVSWLPVIVEHPLLRIGPAVVPGVGACYGCWRRRLRQHAVAPDLEAALERAYRHATVERQAGHLPAAARLAAAVALDVVERLAHDAPGETGRVRQMDLLTRQLTTGKALGVHGCPRCGLGRDERDRSHASLLAELEEVWA